MFSKLGKTSMSVLTGAMFAIAAVSWACSSLSRPKKTPSVRSFINSAGMVMTKIPAGIFKMGLVEDFAQMPVARRKFSASNLYDMRGNVWDLKTPAYESYALAMTSHSLMPVKKNKTVCGHN
jgi:formylglycine-generating enzyme required for sulfatase activity